MNYTFGAGSQETRPTAFDAMQKIFDYGNQPWHVVNTDRNYSRPFEGWILEQLRSEYRFRSDGLAIEDARSSTREYPALIAMVGRLKDE